MLLVYLGVMASIVGIVLLVLSPDADRIGWPIDGAALFLVALGSSWATSLLLPRPLNWTSVGLGLLAVSFLRARHRLGAALGMGRQSQSVTDCR